MNIQNSAGDAAGAAVLGEGVLAHAHAPGDEIGQLRVREFLAMAYYTLGDYRRVIELCERNRAAVGSDAVAPPRMSNIGDHAGVRTYSHLAVALGAIGDFSRAEAAAEEGARFSRDSATVVDRLWVLLGQSSPAVTRGQYTTALPSLEKGLSLARELNLSIWLPVFASWLGYLYARTGRLEEGLRLLEEATIPAETSSRNVWAGNLGRQSEALLLASRPRDARAVAQRGLEGARASGQRASEAQCLRALGEAKASEDLSDADAAMAHLEKALALATELGMRPLVAHCHLGLGKLYRRTGKREQAQEHVNTATTMYREMGMTYWLEKGEAETTDLGR